MKKYEFLLFDLDNTILDFDKSERESLYQLFAENNIECNEETIREYNLMNKDLWWQCEQGLLGLDEVLNTRFSRFLSSRGIEVDGAKWEMRYRYYLDNTAFMMEGALEVVQKLAEAYRLFIITNGVTETQVRRIADAGLTKYFERIFTSQQIGYMKPAKEFFDYVAKGIVDFDYKKALVIGDSFSSDIKGGNIAGIDTCWLATKATDGDCTYVITDLVDILEIL